MKTETSTHISKWTYDSFYLSLYTIPFLLGQKKTPHTQVEQEGKPHPTYHDKQFRKKSGSNTVSPSTQ
jgi:hypothetical protein